MYAYNFKKFIHSPDIANYITEEMFTVGEQAVIISQSRQTIQEKIEALKYLRDRYSEEYYCSRIECPIKECKKRKIRLYDLISRTLDSWNKTLDMQKDNQGVIFASGLNEKGFLLDSLRDYRFFSDYEAAYQWLKKEKQEYLADEELKDVVTYGEILRIKLNPTNDSNSDYERYDFNDNLELVRIFGCENIAWDKCEERLLMDYYVYIPLPFKAGDKVKITLETGLDYYGVIHDNPEKRDWRRYEYCSLADDTDMMAAVEVYDDKEQEWWFTDNSPVLDVRYATEEECKDIPDLPKKIIK